MSIISFQDVAVVQSVVKRVENVNYHCKPRKGNSVTQETEKGGIKTSNPLATDFGREKSFDSVSFSSAGPLYAVILLRS